LRCTLDLLTTATKGEVMGKEARIGLLLGACACLTAVMVDWVIEELNHSDSGR
jgi:hypothetical protein